MRNHFLTISFISGLPLTFFGCFYISVVLLYKSNWFFIFLWVSLSSSSFEWLCLSFYLLFFSVTNFCCSSQISFCRSRSLSYHITSNRLRLSCKNVTFFWGMFRNNFGTPYWLSFRFRRFNCVPVIQDNIFNGFLWSRHYGLRTHFFYPLFFYDFNLLFLFVSFTISLVFFCYVCAIIIIIFFLLYFLTNNFLVTNIFYSSWLNSGRNIFKC